MGQAFNRLDRPDGFLAPQAWPPETARNEAEAPAPSHSAEGTRLRLGILCRCPAQDSPQTAKHPERGQHDWAGGVVRSQTALYKEGPYMDFIGAFMAKPAKTVTVLSAIRYKGQLPMNEQPMLEKPNPWSDPTRGSP